MDMSHATNELYRHHRDFIIIGLTGRTGSGCTTVADVLSKKFSDITLSPASELNEVDFAQEKQKIISRFAQINWTPFTVIHIRDIISTYILECKFDEINNYIVSAFPGIDLNSQRDLFESYKEKSQCLDIIFSDNHDAADPEKVYQFVVKELPDFTRQFKLEVDKKNKEHFIKIYQKIGDNIRKHADAVQKKETLTQHIFALSDRTNQIIKALRNHNRRSNAPDYFVIDAFRNPTEVKFFQDRYSAFYLMAVICDEKHRKNRLLHQSIPYNDIQSIDSKEYSRKNILKDYESFISQDISGCIAIADIIVNNDGDIENKNLNELHDQLVKYISLIQHPALVPPSTDERNMQLAFTAKASSGCISRQVGAAVSDEYGEVLSIGWNDAPKKQVPCVLRCIADLLSNSSKSHFSKYEKNSKEFNEIVKKYCAKLSKAISIGLNIPYCFKTFKNEQDKEKNQVYTRSIHAEEAAFLSLVGKSSKTSNGILYTTASPCVLCAKKAYHLGIGKVVYIDPYPDISFEHIFEFGDTILKYKIFSGAIGQAFHRLYGPVVSLKDEITSYIDDEKLL